MLVLALDKGVIKFFVKFYRKSMLTDLYRLNKFAQPQVIKVSLSPSYTVTWVFQLGSRFRCFQAI